MNISFENPDKVNGLLTITIEKEDYQEKIDKTLKDYRKRARVPGFRPGMVPMGMIKKQYGMAVKAEVVDKMLNENLTAYIRDNKIAMLGQPMVHEPQESIDFGGDGPLTFKFDIAVAPEFKAELTNQDTVAYYKIVADDKPGNLSALITGDRKLSVRVAGPQDMVRKILRGIDGVQYADVTVQAEKGSYDFLVEAKPNVDIRKPMFMALAKAGYPILQLKSMDLSLEDIFLKLVEEKKKQRNPP